MILKGVVMKILITGGTTFVSKYAAEYFVSKDNDVTVINRGSRPQVNGVAHISCDRTALGERLNGKHFDLILDITAYTSEHIKTLLNSGITFDDYIFISSSAVYPETNPQHMKTFTVKRFRLIVLCRTDRSIYLKTAI